MARSESPKEGNRTWGGAEQMDASGLRLTRLDVRKKGPGEILTPSFKMRFS
jgi:hypothetical protein